MADRCALAIIVGSFLVWNPWGLVGRHEIRLLICLPALAWGCRAIVRGPTLRVPRRWMLGVAFAVIMLASAVAADDWRTTVLGHADRHLGLLGWLALCAAVLLGTNLTVQGRAAARLAIEVSGSIVAAYAIGQSVAASVFDRQVDRASSTFGSATYTGACLALVLPFLIDRTLTLDDRRRLAVSACGAGIVGLGLVLTGSRGAWLSGVVGIALVLALHIRHERRRVVLAATAALAVLGLVIVGSGSTRARIESLRHPGEGTAGGRFVLWRAGVRAALDRPILGWGPDRTRVGLPQALPRSFEATYWDRTAPDRVHNAIIDVAVPLGIPAALVFSGAIVAAIVGGVRRSRGRAAGDARIAWLACAIAYLPHLMFNFVQLDVDIVAMMVFGVIASGAAIEVRLPTAAKATFSATFLAAAALGGIYAGGLVVADTVARAGVTAEQAGRVDDADAAYKRAVTWSFGDARYYEMLTRALRRQDDWVASIAAADAAAARHRDDPFYGELPALTRAEAAGIDASYADQAIALYAVLIERWPNHAAYHTGVGVAEALRGRDEPAALAFREAIALSPRSAEPYADLARLLANGGDTTGAIAVLDQGIAVAADPRALAELRDSLAP